MVEDSEQAEFDVKEEEYGWGAGRTDSPGRLRAASPLGLCCFTLSGLEWRRLSEFLHSWSVA